jgi:DNA-directed RNA polymerase III subunit RPC11
MPIVICPVCANLLRVHEYEGTVRFMCHACDFAHLVSEPMGSQIPVKTKEVDDVLGGEAAWANVQKTTIRCERCSHPQAYYREIQIRSADEPTTIFYKCANPKCNYQWSE